MPSLFKAVVATGLALSHFVSSQKITSLVGDGWTLSNPGLNISVPGSVPSQAHLDLYANQVIGNPYFGLNNFNLRWIVWNNWTYTSDPISALSSNASSTLLVFNGLDTFADISFCGQHIANTDNQFRQYWFDVNHLLETCSPLDRVISVNFGSAANIANEIAAQPGQETWPYGIQQIYQFTNRWFVRKEQSDFGWDFAPAFVPSGIWQPAYVVQLEAEQIYVRNSIVDIYRQGQLNNIPPDQSRPWVVNASIDYLGNIPAGASLSYTLTTLDNKTTISSGSLSNVNVTNATVTGSTTIGCDAVDLWWPSQLGPQNLYYLTVKLASPGQHTLGTITKRIGFRTIVLNEFPISKSQLAQGIAPGNNWHFEVNGKVFYAKGSNFIPPDAFWPRITPDRIAQLFDSVIDANQNMLRVWASGAYSPDFLYDLADEKGILLWSEFEFGDALYPVNPDFLENVRQEAEYNVRRVNHHPSLALWAGGNELENLELGMIVNDYYHGLLPYYTDQYQKLFLDTLLPVVFGNSRSISYTPSSTSNGWLSLNFSNPIPIVERYFNLTPGSIYGETDFYDYNTTVLYNDSVYPIGRFSNEFGFHSMPSLQSWQQQISPRDLQFNSSVIMLRNQHFPPGGLNTSDFYESSLGMGEMTNAVEAWYPIPSKTDSVANFSAWCHATQIFQADLYVSEIAFYRRGSGLPNRQLGSLYWQLADMWVAPTWAGIEYDGRWKVMHYRAKDIYQHVVVASYVEDAGARPGEFSVWVTSDLWDSVSGTATLEWFDWSGKPLHVAQMPGSVKFTIGAINSTRIFDGETAAVLRGIDSRNAVLRMRIEAQGMLANEQTVTTFSHENWFHPTGLNNASLVDPGLMLSYSPSTKNFTVTATKGVAAWVWLDYPSGAVLHFDDNGFWLAANESRQLGYAVKSDTTNGKWIKGVTVQSLWNQTLRT